MKTPVLEMQDKYVYSILTFVRDGDHEWKALDKKHEEPQTGRIYCSHMEDGNYGKWFFSQNMTHSSGNKSTLEISKFLKFLNEETEKAIEAAKPKRFVYGRLEFVDTGEFKEFPHYECRGIDAGVEVGRVFHISDEWKIEIQQEDLIMGGATAGNIRDFLHDLNKGNSLGRDVS